MTIIRDCWVHGAADSAAKLAAHDYYLKPPTGGTSQSPVVVQPGYIDLVADPVDATKTVIRCQYAASDIVAGVKSELLPRTPTAADPITDWAGQAAARRWYRFAFLVTDWPEEPRVPPNPQLAVLWQLHDQADSTPDVYDDPPLWLRDDGLGYWVLRNTYDVNAVTTLGTIVKRDLIRFKREINVWNEIVIYMKPSWTSGDLKIWRNRRLIFTETGTPNCFNHQAANGGSYNFIEYGVYGGKTGQVTPRTAYHKGIQVGDEAYTTFDQFLAACGSSDTELESFMTTGVSISG